MAKRVRREWKDYRFLYYRRTNGTYRRIVDHTEANLLEKGQIWKHATSPDNYRVFIHEVHTDETVTVINNRHQKKTISTKYLFKEYVLQRPVTYI